MPGRKKDPFSYKPSDFDRQDDGEASSVTPFRSYFAADVPKATTPATELTPDIAEDMIELVESGMMIQDAANYLMIHPATLRSWLRAGEAQPTSEYGWFAARIRQAQSVFVQEMVVNVRKTAKNDGNVALKVLEKASRGAWDASTSTDVNVSGKIEHVHIGTELARIVEERKAKKAQLNDPAAAELTEGSGTALTAPLEGVIVKEDES